jgi:heavy metal sensor kinase
LALVLIGFSALIYGLLARALYAGVDRSLRTELSELEEDARVESQLNERMRHWIYELKEHENILSVVYDQEGQVYERTVELAASAIPPAPSVSSGEPIFANATLPIIGRQRTLAGRLSLGGSEFTILMMSPMEEVDRELGALLSVLAMAVPIAIVLAGGLAYGMARKALAPVNQLDRLTKEITAERLDRRLRPANPSDELGRLTQTINDMIGRLERSFSEIRRFTADASHEIRTPLTAIRTETEVALRHPLTVSEYQQLLGSILEECERLARLTDQLLTLAREDAGSGRAAWEAVDLARIINDVTETLRPVAENKGLRLLSETNGPVKISGNHLGLRQVFFNVLDNAIKYTPPGGDVNVQLNQRNGEAVVTIRDTGIGIAAEHLPHVFDRFYRVDKARSRAEGGTGLGLSIAQSTLAVHGGRIELASAPGQGTTCMIHLPAESMQSKKSDGEEAS